VVQHQAQHQQFLQLQTQGVVGVVAQIVLLVVMVALASSSFVTLQHNQHQLQQLVHHKLTLLTATKSILGHPLEL
jgi:hypothetical protein